MLHQFVQDLHSKHDNRIALRHLIDTAPDHAEYMNDFLLFCGGDYPTWKYNKKIVAGVSNQLQLNDHSTIDKI